MTKLTYQPHIDGLRAIAVLSVLIYHIDNSWLPGGFVGVDIFFVISGFLITRIISNAILENKFSIEVFYNRRIKRILPVYFLVSSVSIIFALLIFFPGDLNGFADSLLSSTFFVSNFYFWQSSGYFSSAIELKPLVHTWSLSVEEQFYVFWPLTLILVYKFKNSFFKKLSFFSFFTVSLILSCILSKSNPEFAYYSIFTRAFELLIGAIAAIYIKDSMSTSKALSYSGFILIIISFIVIDKYSNFPGIIALLPCIGAVFLIISGNSNTLPIRLLESKIAVSIGLVSYSLYMWHWPILAFARYYFTNLNNMTVFFLVALMFGLSYLTRYTIEEKVMRSQLSFKQSFSFLFLLPALAFLAIASYIHLNDGIKSRFSSEVLTLIEQTQSGVSKCSRERFELIFDGECYIKSTVEESQKKRILLWGDSHANHFRGFFEEVAKNEPIDIYEMSFPGCPPIAGIYRINRNYSESCYSHNIKIQELLLAKEKFDYVALAANWANYPKAANLADDKNKEISTQNSERAFYDNLSRQLRLFSQRGIKVIFLNSVPNFKNNASQCQIKNLVFGYPEEKHCQRPVQEIIQLREYYDEFVTKTIRPLDNVFVLDFIDYFCRRGSCKAFIDGNMMYRDQNHITEHASKLLYQEFFDSEKNLQTMLEE
jgi:peptidoglycan/LPS O-acetylase OafA/YrhL